MSFHFANRLNPEIKKKSPRLLIQPGFFRLPSFLIPFFFKQDKSAVNKFTAKKNDNWVIGPGSLSAKNTYFSAAIADHISGLLRISIFKPAAAKKYNESV